MNATEIGRDEKNFNSSIHINIFIRSNQKGGRKYE